MYHEGHGGDDDGDDGVVGEDSVGDDLNDVADGSKVIDDFANENYRKESKQKKICE